MNLSERSFSELPTEPRVPAHRRRAARQSSDAEHPGCVPTAAVPSQSRLPALRCSGARQRAQRPGARPGRGVRPQRNAPAGPRSAGSARAMRAARQPRLRLFVRAADGSAERSRLCPAMAALTSKCTLSRQSITVSSVPTIALWCCIVLPPLAPSTAFPAIHRCESCAETIAGWSAGRALLEEP